MIAVIDYGAGNLRSVTNILGKLGHKFKVTREPEDMANATAVIFPGVGAAANVMQVLRQTGMDEAIKEGIYKGQPFFAICVGMQALLSATEEGGWNKCLDVIPGKVKRLPAGLKVPHMGWNQLRQVSAHPIFNRIPDGSNFYFVHSYYAEPEDISLVAGMTEYGVNLCSMLIKDNLIATQFHPEKSGELGLRMYANFFDLARVKE